MKFIFIRAHKYTDKKEKLHLEKDCGQKCRFGYCWWLWMPRFKIRLHSRYKIAEIMWLNMSLSYEGLME